MVTIIIIIIFIKFEIYFLFYIDYVFVVVADSASSIDSDEADVPSTSSSQQKQQSPIKESVSETEIDAGGKKKQKRNLLPLHSEAETELVQPTHASNAAQTKTSILSFGQKRRGKKVTYAAESSVPNTSDIRSRKRKSSESLESDVKKPKDDDSTSSAMVVDELQGQECSAKGEHDQLNDDLIKCSKSSTRRKSVTFKKVDYGIPIVSPSHTSQTKAVIAERKQTRRRSICSPNELTAFVPRLTRRRSMAVVKHLVSTSECSDVEKLTTKSISQSHKVKEDKTGSDLEISDTSMQSAVSPSKRLSSISKNTPTNSTTVRRSVGRHSSDLRKFVLEKQSGSGLVTGSSSEGEIDLKKTVNNTKTDRRKWKKHVIECDSTQDGSTAECYLVTTSLHFECVFIIDKLKLVSKVIVTVCRRVPA